MATFRNAGLDWRRIYMDLTTEQSIKLEVLTRRSGMHKKAFVGTVIDAEWERQQKKDPRAMVNAFNLVRAQIDGAEAAAAKKAAEEASKKAAKKAAKKSAKGAQPAPQPAPVQGT